MISGPKGPLAIYHFAFENRRGRRLLVLKLDHYGDFLIGLPALKRLRQTFPADRITLVCGSWNVALAKELQLADEVHAYDFFPENGALWSEQPFESVQRYAGTAVDQILPSWSAPFDPNTPSCWSGATSGNRALVSRSVGRSAVAAANSTIWNTTQRQ